MTKASLVAGIGFPALTSFAPAERRLTILHTNDWHSRIEAFAPDHGRYPGMGGIAKRAALIKDIRSKEKNVILLDAGDIFQGTPYFNEYGGELEFKLMSELGYDAATLGNHDFDAGLEGLQKQMPHATFKLLSANYDFDNTILSGQVAPYEVFEKDDLKIGVFGLGIELDGLVPKHLYADTLYLDPLEKANSTASVLKNELECDLVICLSHLGFKYTINKISDVVLAEETTNIDVILGGHTHSLLEEPVEILNQSGEKVLINQVGWAGLYLGRIDLVFESKRKKKITPLAPVKIR